MICFKPLSDYHCVNLNISWSLEDTKFVESGMSRFKIYY